jgi:hypothetical protein
MRYPRSSLFARRLLFVVGEVKKAIQDLTEAVTEVSKTANAKQNIPPLVRTEIKLPESIVIHKSKNDATDEKNISFTRSWVSHLCFGRYLRNNLRLVVVRNAESYHSGDPEC